MGGTDTGTDKKNDPSLIFRFLFKIDWGIDATEN